MYTVGSLFTGIGGIDLGLERTGGFTVSYQVEKDPWCRRVLKKHWPDVARYDDITTLDPSTLPPVDVLCAGWPCQPVSQAGEQKGTLDDNWLWPYVVKFIRNVAPRITILENVSGLFASGRGTTFGQVVGDLASLRYDCEWALLRADHTVGAPHRRERVWIVAYANHEGQSSLSFDEESRVFVPSLKQRHRRWPSPPKLDRMAPGIPEGMDRLVGLGNSVIPHTSELIGNRVLTVYKEKNNGHRTTARPQKRSQRPSA
jgi:DNA (cytosine-5)-methyltransferase 1